MGFRRESRFTFLSRFAPASNVARPEAVQLDPPIPHIGWPDGGVGRGEYAGCSLRGHEATGSLRDLGDADPSTFLCGLGFRSGDHRGAPSGRNGNRRGRSHGRCTPSRRGQDREPDLFRLGRGGSAQRTAAAHPGRQGMDRRRGSDSRAGSGRRLLGRTQCRSRDEAMSRQRRFCRYSHLRDVRRDRCRRIDGGFRGPRIRSQPGCLLLCTRAAESHLSLVDEIQVVGDAVFRERCSTRRPQLG